MVPGSTWNDRFSSTLGYTGLGVCPSRFGVRFTHQALVKADKNIRKRRLWLKILDAMNLGFTC
jgi:hypothetical protein